MPDNGIHGMHSLPSVNYLCTPPVAVPVKSDHDGEHKEVNHDQMVMKDRHESLKRGEDQQMVGLD